MTAMLCKERDDATVQSRRPSGNNCRRAFEVVALIAVDEVQLEVDAAATVMVSKASEKNRPESATGEQSTQN